MISSSEQPKEYIITEFQLKQLQDFASLEFVCQAIRKRPHPAPQEDGCKFRVAKMEAMYDNGYADGSRKAREDVLEAIQDHNDGRLEGMEILFATPSNERTESAQDVYLKEAYFELTLVKHLIESLRSTTPQTEQEQPR